ncbi:hypothetical protein [Streptomyces sp. NPDC002547]
MDLVKTAKLEDALSELASVFGDGMTAYDTGSKFTCSEADSVARVLIFSGNEEAAVTWLKGHADGEDWDDSHAHEYDEEQDKGRTEPRKFDEGEIRDYVKGLAI